MNVLKFAQARTCLCVVLLFIANLSLVPQMMAGLIGEDVFAQYNFSNGQTFFGATKVVGNDVEFTDTNLGYSLFELDLFDSYALFRITNTTNGGLGILGTGRLDISGISDSVVDVVATQTKLGMFPDNNPSFSVNFDSSGISFFIEGPLGFSVPGEDKEWRLDIKTASVPDAGASTLVLLGFSLSMCLFLRRSIHRSAEGFRL